MKKLLAVVISVLLILWVVAPVSAAEPSRKPLTPPELKNITFIHYVKPDNPGKPHKEKPEPEGSYKLLGICLPDTADYCVNVLGAPPGSLDEIKVSFEEWDGYVTKDLFQYAGTTGASGVRQDGINVVSWVRIAPPKIIGITSLWYLDDHDPSTLDPIKEFDIAFNSFLDWGVGLGDAFDVQNIATHEAGHALGLDDLYEDQNADLTMYGYSSVGETKKSTLEDGDIDGVNAIYSTSQ